MLDPLQIEPSDDDEQLIPLLFVGFVALVIFVFAAVLAPELIGQSILPGSIPTYIVRPNELNDIIAY
jgi:hypothetical protein